MYVVKAKERGNYHESYSVWPNGAKRECATKQDAIERWRLYLEMANRGIAVEGVKAETVFIVDTSKTRDFGHDACEDIVLAQSIDMQTSDGLERGEPVGPWAKKVVMS